eukprot:CAMPEP_0181404234 /NCGR_PEP_ID=MMETSP1110-20121109/4135_1 /TAXON_ID=174948 /ORGANISM="Symbiodinium sp., Strain CCMP421" /LENGTH=105 /DNA_ID=CAMNT_0023526577 /DNA_START=44 /DNA_END=358 /DNA_ORIENTATION=+
MESKFGCFGRCCPCLAEISSFLPVRPSLPQAPILPEDDATVPSAVEPDGKSDLKCSPRRHETQEETPCLVGSEPTAGAAVAEEQGALAAPQSKDREEPQEPQEPQ